MKVVQLLRKIFLLDLFAGLSVTFRQQTPDSIVTEQYPLQRPKIAPAYRGQPKLVKDPLTGELLCNACGACALACPEKLITVDSVRDEKTKKKVLTGYKFDLSRCMFCGLCEEACPTDALDLTPEFELALYSREGMVFDKSVLADGLERKVYEK